MRNRGMPIYLDDVPRSISDVAAEVDTATHDWEPANKAAQKLCRCLDAMRDIACILEEASSAGTKDKRRRKVKIILTPLASLAKGVVDLLNYAECDSEARRNVGLRMHGFLGQIRDRFLQYVPLERKKLLSTLRDKVSAHVDESLYPGQARDLFSKAHIHEVGFWIHVSIAVLLDLCKLPMYAWACDCHEEGIFRLMTNEPFLLTFAVEGNKLLGLHIVRDPPTRQVYKLMDGVIQSSSWMFGQSHKRVRGLVEHQEQKPWPECLLYFPKPEGV